MAAKKTLRVRQTGSPIRRNETQRKTLVGLGLVFLGGCSVSPMPDNIEQVSRGGGYQAQYREPPSAIAKPVFLESATMNAQRCKPLLGGGFTDMAQGGKGGKLAALPLLGERVTRNDLVDVRVDDDEVLNGSYVISRDGTLKLPFLDPIRAQGRTTDDIEADLGRALLAEGFYETLYASVPDHRLIAIDEALHFVMLDQPEAFWAAARTALSL